jgi:putative ABC transport system permease protein
MNFMESFKSAIQSIRSNKMRSFLTMLGIIIGISSVITIVSIGEGGRKYIAGEFEDIGTNVINLRVKAANNDIDSSDFFTMEDAELIKNKIPKVKSVMPLSEGFGRIRVENKSKEAAIEATTESYFDVLNADLLNGRILNEHDVQTAKSVAVIDDIAAMKLFHSTEVIGEKITIKVQDKAINPVIVGVIKNPNGNLAAAFGDNFPATVIIPITIADKILQNTDIGFMSVTLTDMTNSKEISNKIVRLLEKKHRNSGKYAAEEGFKQLDTLNKVLSTFTAVIGAIAGISLIVGGIGVMNIMLVSVTERTREIGIRKALGAKRRDIAVQFLTESLILCLIGGAIGMTLGVSLGYAAGRFINVSAVVSPKVIAISFLFSSAVGIFFGIYPANKAAKLDPIEALRYE